MANWATTCYAIEGSKDVLQKIYNAIKNHPVEEGSSDGWEGNVLKALDIEWKESDYMRGFINEEPWWDDKYGDYALRFCAEEAWGATDFNEVLERNLPVKVFYVVEEPGEEVYATNDKDSRYFSDRYYVDTCINGNYQSDYFIEEEKVYKWLSYLTYGKVSTDEDVEEFNEKAEEEDSEDFIYIHEFKVVE